MKKIPILFSAPMVRAILEGRKTQTRRLQTKAQPGDVLWARETWRFSFAKKLNDFNGDFGAEAQFKDGSKVECEFKGERADIFGKYVGKMLASKLAKKTVWNSSIYMPLEACRLFLKVKAVRRERLQDMDIASCVKEGVTIYEYENWCIEAKPKFIELWDSLHNKPGERWEDNPEVSVIEFNKIENFNEEAI